MDNSKRLIRSRWLSVSFQLVFRLFRQREVLERPCYYYFLVSPRFIPVKMSENRATKSGLAAEAHNKVWRKIVLLIITKFLNLDCWRREIRCGESRYRPSDLRDGRMHLYNLVYIQGNKNGLQ